MDSSSTQKLPNIQSVAVIGAGVSGILATRYLSEAGLDVTVFERNAEAGGIWIYDENTPPEPHYPATKPLETAWDLCPWYDPVRSKQRPAVLDPASKASDADWVLRHAPPGPCYNGLTNNFSVLAMELKDHPWPWVIPPVTPANPDHESEWTTHPRILSHLQVAARKFGLTERVHYRTLVERVRKQDDKWILTTTTLEPVGEGALSVDKLGKFRVRPRKWEFDAVVVASGHYNTPRVPDIPGLEVWRSHFPNRVEHSKSYRRPEKYANQNVLLVGGGTSSTEIARELGKHAKKMYQSGRGSMFDLPVEFLPDNCERICEVTSFGNINSTTPGGIEPTEPILATVNLQDGTVLTDIHSVIVCTGYHYVYPFMPEFHDDTRPAIDATSESKYLATDGSCTLNLDRDMFYIHDPTLAFAGISLFIATFAFYEYQAMAIAAAFSGKGSLPSGPEMQKRYQERLVSRGPTRFMNARMDEEVSYVDQLVQWLNESDPSKHIEGFSTQWHAVRDAGKLEKIRARFAREKAQKK